MMDCTYKCIIIHPNDKGCKGKYMQVPPSSFHQHEEIYKTVRLIASLIHYFVGKKSSSFLFFCLSVSPVDSCGIWHPTSGFFKETNAMQDQGP